MIYLKALINKKTSKALLIAVTSIFIVIITVAMQLVKNIDKIEIDMNGGPYNNVKKFSIHKINEKNIFSLMEYIEKLSKNYDIELSTTMIIPLDGQGVEDTKFYLMPKIAGVSYTDKPVWIPKVNYINTSSMGNEIIIGQDINKHFRENGLITGENAVFNNKEYKILGLFENGLSGEIHISLNMFENEFILDNLGNAFLKIGSINELSKEEVEGIKADIGNLDIEINDINKNDYSLFNMDKGKTKTLLFYIILFVIFNFILFVKFELRGRMKFFKVSFILGLTKKNLLKLLILENIIVGLIMFLTTCIVNIITLRVFKKFLSDIFATTYIDYNPRSLLISFVIALNVCVLISIYQYTTITKKIYK